MLRLSIRLGTFHFNTLVAVQFSDNFLLLAGKQVPFNLNKKIALDCLISIGLPRGAEGISVMSLRESPGVLEALDLELRKSSLWDFVDSKLSADQVAMCEKLGLLPEVNSILSESLFSKMCDLVEIFEVNIDKDCEGELYLWAYTLDPFKRIWQICLSEYVEGWHALEDEFLESFEWYRKMNGA